MQIVKKKSAFLFSLLILFVSCENKHNPLLGVWQNDKVYEIVNADYASSKLLFGDSIVGERWELNEQNSFYKLDEIVFESDKWRLSGSNGGLYTPYKLINDSTFESWLANSKYTFTFHFDQDTLFLKGVNRYFEEEVLLLENSIGSTDSIKVTGKMIQRRFIKQVS